MTQEDKELLLKDLCARLPYGVKVNEDIQGDFTLVGLTKERAFTTSEEEGYHNDFPIELIKPYLFPLSSMTEEQLKDLGTYYAKDYKNIIDDAIKSLESPLVMYKAAHVCFNTLEWHNKNHFDYRGLIEKGLAIDATGLDIY